MQKLIIKKILIKDSPAFKEATLYPHLNFNVFSGASGAGKSVLMDSILALFGLKETNAKLLEATLELSGIPSEFEGLLEEGEVILTLSKNDKVRYFINAQNIPKKKIVELFSPFLKHLGTKSLDATSEANLFLTLDSFCASKDKNHFVFLDNYKKAFENFNKIKKELEKLQDDALKVAELKEFVSFEIQKLESLNPKVGEYEELLELKKEISKKEKIEDSLQEVQNFLSHSYKVANFLKLINKEENQILESLNALEMLCEEESQRLQELSDFNAEEILNRLESLSSLKHRYGGVNEALEYLEAKKQELKTYENLDSILKETQTKFDKASKDLSQKAESLLKQREKHLSEFEKTLNAALKSLKMPNAKVTLNKLESFSHLGNAELKISINGELKNLSAGEFNRMRLALLLTKSTATQEAVIILDEVDANLSGEESEGVAKALKQ
ncbi:MAG: DNA repair protein, partial [Helicobacter sp.]|nr:DNA repair protein [Helicobacter sp.]